MADRGYHYPPPNHRRPVGAGTAAGTAERGGTTTTTTTAGPTGNTNTNGGLNNVHHQNNAGANASSYLYSSSPIPRTRNVSRSASSSARNSGIFPDHRRESGNFSHYNNGDIHGSGVSSSPHLQQTTLQQSYRYSPSLRSVGSRVSLSEQFATTRREYEFGFDDAMSLFAPSVDAGEGEEYAYSRENSDSEDGLDDDDDDETSTAAGSSIGGMVIVQGPSPPLSTIDDDDDGEGENKEDKKKPSSSKGTGRKKKKKDLRRRAIKRSPQELLCLDAKTATMDDIRGAYFRLCDLFRSKNLEESSKDLAEKYFTDIQRSFEYLIASKKTGRRLNLPLDNSYDYDEEEEEDDDDTSSTESGYDDDEEDEDQRSQRRADSHFAERVRRQQKRPWQEVGLQASTKPLISTRGPRGRDYHRPSAALSITDSSTVSMPAVISFLEPKLEALFRRHRRGHGIEENQADDHDELPLLYCPPTTSHFTSSISTVATTSRYNNNGLTSSSSLTTLGAEHQENLFLLPDTVSNYRPLQGYPFDLFCILSYNVRLRQELFFLTKREQLRRAFQFSKNTTIKKGKKFETSRLPDAVFEIEADAFRPGSLAARASFALPTADGQQQHPLHVETSVSLDQLTGLLFGGNPRFPPGPRLGLALHKRQQSGTLFACVDSGSSLLSTWGHKKQRGLFSSSRLWEKVAAPTVEVGYRFGDGRGGRDSSVLGMQSGRPFTKQAKSGLRRLDDEADLVSTSDQGGMLRPPTSSCESWTISGAATPSSVACYLRYGQDVAFPIPRPRSATTTTTNTTKRGRLLHAEAELCAQKTFSCHGGFSLDNLLTWVWSGGHSELGYLAIRGLTTPGKSSSSRFGLELSINQTHNIVLSLFFSSNPSNSNINRRIALPILLLRGPLSSSPAITTNILSYGAAALMLSAAAFDVYRLWRRRTRTRDRKSATEKEQQEEERLKKKKLKAKKRRIAALRAEADDLVTLLAGPVGNTHTHHQKLEIISAKYGVLLPFPPGRPPNNTPPDEPSPSPSPPPPPQWATPEEVADVTVAIAALVQDGQKVCIPEGLRKSRLLGFWDPEPTRRKCLVVRYVYKGQEGVKAVLGREELVLP